MQTSMAITEGVQEQLHHRIMCFSSQHVPINFSDMGPTPACSEAKGYRDIDCEVLHTISILQGPVHLPSMQPLLVELGKGFSIIPTTTVVHNKNESLQTRVTASHCESSTPK